MSNNIISNNQLKGDSKGILTIFISIFILFILLSLLYQIYRFYFPYFPDNAAFDNCLWTRWGCCKDQITPKYDIDGSNCKRIGDNNKSGLF